MASYEEDISNVSGKQNALLGKGALVSEKYIPRTMPRILGTWDMTTTFVVSTYLATVATTAATAGPAALTYLLLTGAAFFLPCLIATMQLGVMFPYEGALYNWTHKALGGYWSFFSGFCAWFPGVLISSSLANLFVTYLQEMHTNWFISPWQSGIAISAILIFAGLVSIQRFRTVQNLINILVVLMFIGTLLMGASAVFWLASGHSSITSFSNWSSWNIKPTNIALFGSIAFAYIGTEGPLNLAGETVGKHVIKRHLWGGALLILVAYIINTLSVLIVLGPKADGPFSMVTAVDIALGTPFASIAAVCFMGSFIATVLAYNYIYARLLLVASIDRHLPRAIGKLNKHSVPANAILFQTVLAVLFTLIIFVVAPLSTPYENQMNFSVAVYNISQAAAALIWAISAAFLFINLVGCSIRHRQLFHQKRIFPMPVLWISAVVGLVSCLLAIIDTLLFSWTQQINNNQWWYLVGSLTLIFLIIAGVGSMLANSEAYWQDFRKQ